MSTISAALSPGIPTALSDPSEITSILMSLSIIAIVIPTLFFVVGSRVESEVVTKNAYYVVDGLTQGFRDVLTPDQLLQLRGFVTQYIVVPDMSAQDQVIAAKNQSLLVSAYKAIGIGVGLALLVMLYLWAKNRFPVGPMLFENLLVGVAVAAVELSILLFVGRNYKSAQVNSVKLAVVKALQKFGEA